MNNTVEQPILKRGIIKSYLRDIERNRGIRILYACESGSRAWGFSSVNSDYDVRFIYKAPAQKYLSVNEMSDTISHTPENNDVELHGWDLKKTLSLIVKGNAAVREWVNSPTVYFQDDIFMHAFEKRILNHYNDLLPLEFHYYGLAKNTWHKYIDFSTPIIAKKYLYVIRPVLAGLWIHQQNEFPPLDINTLLTIAPEPIRQYTMSIIEAKALDEWARIMRISDLDYFLLHGMSIIDPRQHGKITQKSYDVANKFFYDVVRYYLFPSPYFLKTLREPKE